MLILSESTKDGIIKELDVDNMGFYGDESPEDINNYIDSDPIAMAIIGMNIGNGLSIANNLTTINFTNKFNPKKYLVIHYTAGKVDNGTAAKANTNYFKDQYIGASAHFFVDRNPIVYRCVNEDEVAWHCGTSGSYYHNNCRNSNSIGIELCSYFEDGKYKFNDDTIKHGALLSRYLIAKYNIPKENILMHWHITHKVCAIPFLNNNGPNDMWNDFKDLIFNQNNHWCDPIRDGLLKLGIITDKSSWSKYDEPITKALAVKLISNFLGGEEDLPITTHWADNAVNNLYRNKIITDKGQWEGNLLDDYISKALYLALLDRLTGGMEQKYVDRETDHWGRNHLDSLCDKEVINTPEIWTKFEDQVQKDIAMAALYKIINK